MYSFGACASSVGELLRTILADSCIISKQAVLERCLVSVQEADVKKALDAACGAAQAPAEVFEQLCRFHRAIGDISLAKEAGFKWLRGLQAHGWQEDETSAADVAGCCAFLYR